MFKKFVINRGKSHQGDNMCTLSAAVVRANGGFPPRHVPNHLITNRSSN